MRKLNILIIDNDGTELNDINDWFGSTVIFQKYCNEPKLLNYINYGSDCLFKCIDVNRIDIAFVDLFWDTLPEIYENTKGGELIIDQIKQRYPNCLCIPATKKSHKSDPRPVHIMPNGNAFSCIPKDATLRDKTKHFYTLLENWQLFRIKQINNANEWRKLISVIQTGNYTRQISFENEMWLISEFLFSEIELNGQIFFERKNLETEIKKLISYPKKGRWGNKLSWGPCTMAYMKFIELDNKETRIKKNIRRRTILYIKNILERYKGSKNELENLLKIDNVDYTQNIKIDGFEKYYSVHQFDNTFINSLILRLVIITICRIARLVNNHELTKCTLIIDLIRGKDVNNEVYKQFVLSLGLKTKNNGTFNMESYINELFYEEESFITEYLETNKTNLIKILHIQS